MMKLLRNRKVAWFITILVIAFSVVIVGGSKLAKEAESVEAVFEQGVKLDGMSIAHDLARSADIAYNYYTVARRYMAEETPALVELLAARSDLLSAERIEDKSEAQQRLTEAVVTLYGQLADYSLNERDLAYRESLLAELRSANAIMEHDGYNDLARDFNRLREGWPAKLIALLYGVEPLAYF